MNQELLEIFKNDNYYKNSSKDFFDNIDNLVKYIENTFAKTDESKKVILDMLSGETHNPNDLYNYRITQEELFRLNKEYYDNTYLYHGLNAYTTNLTDKSIDVSKRIENNLYNIVNDKEIELATSSTHMIGDIGVKGKGNSLFAQPWDMYSIIDKETGKRSKPKSASIITENDIFGIIDKYENNPKNIKSWKNHDEVIAKNFEIESLWVKKDFYDKHQDLVLKLLKDNGIQNLDIIHSNSFEQFYDINTERISVEKLDNKVITGTINSIEKPTLNVYSIQDEAKIIPELEKYQGQTYSLAFDTKTFNQSRFINIDENGQYYLKDAKPEPIIKTPTEPEPIKNTNNELTPSFIDENGNIKEEYIIKKKLTPKEAFDKYGPDDDRFYTSQGLDPKVKRKKVEKLNSKRKPVKTDKEILENVAIKPEELDNFAKENEQLLKEINELKNNNTKTTKIESEKNVEEASEKVTKSVQKATEKNVEEISEEVSEEITKELPKKKLSKSASEAINKIGDIKISKAGKIGLVAAALGIGAYAIGSNKKDNKKEEKQQTPNYQTHVANTTQANYNNDLMYNSYAQQMAKDISSYRYGKQMTGFV